MKKLNIYIRLSAKILYILLFISNSFILIITYLDLFIKNQLGLRLTKISKRLW